MYLEQIDTDSLPGIDEGTYIKNESNVSLYGAEERDPKKGRPKLQWHILSSL